MFRLIQLIRNLFIRIEGFITYQLKKLFSFLAQIFGFFGKLFGFTQESQYFLEDQPQNTKQVETKQPIEAAKTSPDPASTRRRPDAKMDYYLKLAQPKKASK